MTAPESKQEVRPYTAPAWMLQKTTQARERQGLTQEDVTPKIHQAVERALSEATSHLSVGNTAKARAKKGTTDPFKSVKGPKLDEQNRTVELQKESVPKIAQRLLQAQNKDERRAKKDFVRAKQAPTLKDNLNTPPPDQVTSPTITVSATRGESSTVAAVDDSRIVSSRSLFVSENHGDRYPVHPTLPKWYVSIGENNHQMKELGRRRPQELTALDSLKECIARCEKEKKQSVLDGFHEELRNYIHKAEIVLNITKFIAKKARILSPETGLPRIFHADTDFPSDLKADAFQLYTRWYKEDFEQNILRGIETVKGKDRNGDRLDPTYRAKYPPSLKEYGDCDFVLGQWWPTQLCTVRDGAHGATQGGISGERDKGAYSIVLSGGGYHDHDAGDIIEYSGTEGKSANPTENTMHMLKSTELGNPVRVIRSSMLAKNNKYRPERGLRYDGLYQVKGSTLVDEKKAMYRFCLERCEGQDPIRYEDNAARRPTVFEVAEYERLTAKI